MAHGATLPARRGSLVARRLARPLLGLVLVLWGVSTLLFFLVRLSGDPAGVLAGPFATTDQVAQVRADLGLDRPLPVQYLHFLLDTARLDFGESFRFREPAIDVVASRIDASLLLTFAGVLLAVAVAIPVGVFAAARRGTASSHLILSATLVGQSIPSFVLAIVLILVFAVHLSWFPSFGFDGALSVVLPAVSLSAFLMARQTRLVRAYMVEELSKDYVSSAVANGYSRFRVLFRHALRNVLIPIVALAGVDFGVYFGGAIVIEAVFAWPGIGRVMVDAVQARDYPVVQAAVFVIALLVFAVNRGVEALYSVIDPRLRAP